MSYLYKSNSVLQAYTGDPSDDPGIIKFTVGGISLLYPIIFTSYNLQKNEKVQISESFGEYIHIYAFGKSADVLQVAGNILADGDLNKNLAKSGALLLDEYNTNFRAFVSAQKGQLITISRPGDIVFTGVCIGLNLGSNAQYLNLLEFSMNLVAVDSSLAFEKGDNSSSQNVWLGNVDAIMRS